jgi:hypothetical protein
MPSLYSVSEWVLLGILCLVLLAASEIGYRLGISQARRRGQSGSYLTHEVSALGVLALLLGFSFSIAAGKFEVRRGLVLEEANAIGTAALRGQMLPAGYADEAKVLFDRYAVARVRLFDAGIDAAGQRAAMAESERVHDQLWTLARQALEVNRLDVGTGLFISALNDVIDMHGKRKAAYAYRLPDAIFLLIYAVAAIAFVLSGVAAGVHESRSRVPTYVMALLVTAVILFIIDLDRPQRGLLQINDQAILDLVPAARGGR